MRPCGEPLLSVVIPSFNSGRYLRQTLDSVFAQSFDRLEVVAVDGGSTDGTLEILTEYRCRYGERFRYISESDDGQSHALNKGFGMSRGPLLAWQNADDYYLPDAFSAPVEFMRQNPNVAVTYGDYRTLNGETGAMSSYSCGGGSALDYERLMRGNVIPSQTTIIRRDALIECGGVAEDLKCAMDYDLWLRIGLHHSIAHVPGFRAVFRVLRSSMSNVDPVRTANEATTALIRVLAREDIPPNVRDYGPQALQYHIFEEVRLALLAGTLPMADARLYDCLLADPALTLWHTMRRDLGILLLAEVGLQSATMAVTEFYRSLVRQDGNFDLQLRELAALIYWLHALDLRPGARRRAFSYAVQALSSDRWWLRSKLPLAMPISLVRGDRLNTTLRWLFEAGILPRQAVSRMRRELNGLKRPSFARHLRAFRLGPDDR